jgi:hypothetical protein
MALRLRQMIAEDMIAIGLTPPFHAILATLPDYLMAAAPTHTVADRDTHNCIG